MTRRTEGSEAGFLLIGVIMFVLALTIIGLSLYSLSSYEAQFVRQSHDENVALYHAQGGLEMVRSILSLPSVKTLDAAHTAIGHEDVTWATAYQIRSDGSLDSLHDIDFADTVNVDVLVREGATSRRVHCSYLPTPRVDYYKRLFTIAGLIDCPGVNTSSSVPNKNSTVISGEVWQPSGYDPNAWVPELVWNGGPAFKRAPLPLPDLGSYFIAHPFVAANPTTITTDPVGNIDAVSLVSPGLSYFWSPWSDYQPFTRRLDVDVQNTVVWEFPHGFHTENVITINGNGANATLIIVAGPNGTLTGFTDVGIWLHGGIVATNVNVILVSDGGVRIEHNFNYTNDGSAPRLSVFANTLYLMGPTPPSKMTLGYDAAYMDAVIDANLSAGALPLPAGGTTNNYAFLKGSWRELKP